LYEEALTMQRRFLLEDHRDIGWSTAGIGLSLLGVRDYAGAVPHLEQAIAILSKSLPPDHDKLLKLMEDAERCRAVLSAAADHSPSAAGEDWSSKLVRELKAFLRSRGVDLRGMIEKDDLVQAATAIQAKEQQLEGRGGGGKGV
jgi:hypothetical protein